LFFYAAKILWFLAQPSTLDHRRRGGRAILCATSWCRLGRRTLMVAVPVLVIGGIYAGGDLLIAPARESLSPRRCSRGDIAGIIVLGGAEDNRAAPRVSWRG
jgi:hypothetical protein